MLEAITYGKMRYKIKIYTDMRGKLEGSSEIFIPQFVLADDCRVDTQINADFILQTCKIDAGSDRAY